MGMEKNNQKNMRIPVDIHSSLSLMPLFKAWHKAIDEGTGELYKYLYNRVQAHPEFLEPVSVEVFTAHKALVEEIMNTVFPLTFSEKEDVYAVTCPFSTEVVYSSSAFKKQFLPNGELRLSVPVSGEENLDIKIKAAACQMVLAQHYDLHLKGEIKPVFVFPNAKTGLNQYYEFEINNNLVEAIYTGEKGGLPAMPEMEIHKLSDLVNRPELMEWIPLNQFRFEGVSIMQITEVTEKSVVNNIKNILLNLQTFSEATIYESLQSQVEDLAGVPGLAIGVTPFFKIGDRPVFPVLGERQSLLMRGDNDADKNQVANNIQSLFSKKDKTFLIESISEEDLRQYGFLSPLKEEGYCCLAIFPIRHNERLLGILEVASRKEKTLQSGVMNKIEAAIPLFELALKKISDNLEAQVDKVIKEQFTAIQPAVEWSFIDAAVDYILRQQQEEEARIKPIVFNDVYPLYGAVDIRNSTVERNNAIQEDLLEQLEMVSSIITRACGIRYFPILQEIDFKVKKYIHAARNIILSDEEMSINRFLTQDIIQLFQHLQNEYPELKESIQEYFSMMDPNINMLYKNRKQFDESIGLVNRVVAKLIDHEQFKAQEMYPHYFERFVTDGVDFNIYVGHSLCPEKEFNTFYLRNLKLWQLSTLAKAAQVSAKLENNLSVKLQTTQLILAHRNPISISFRHAERKFDVDGAYNIRYEIIKKRIDKVRVKDTNDRLTQPGTISIVYSQLPEADEYLEYIDYFINEGVLKGEVERFDLEELQGVSGLKALRIGIVLDQPAVEKDGKKAVAAKK